MIPLSTWLSDHVGLVPQQAPEGPVRPARESAAAGDIDLEALLAERYEAGVHRGHESAQREAEAAMAERVARFEAEKAALRQQWIATEAEVLAALCREAIARMRSAIEADIALALKPFLAGRIRERSLQAFRSALTGHIQAKAGADVSLSLPEEFRKDFERHMEASDGVASVTNASGAECFAASGDISFETCIGEWLAVLEESPDE